MSFKHKGLTDSTVVVTVHPNETGNFVCSGSADHVEIQAAVDYAEALGVKSKIVIKGGDYSIDTAITLDDYAYIEVNGKIEQTTSDEVFDLTGSSGDHIIQVTITGHGTLKCPKNAATYHIIKCSYVDDLLIDGVRLEGGGTSGVACGMKFDYCTSLTVTNCTLYDIGSYGIALGTDTKHFIISNCTLQTIGHTGIISFTNASYGTIDGNTIRDVNTEHCIYLNTDSTQTWHVTVSNNNLYDAIANGIKFNQTMHCVATGNTIVGCLNGITVGTSQQYDSMHNVISGNTFKGTGKAGGTGIYVTSDTGTGGWGDVKYTSITGNDVTYYQYGIYIYKEHADGACESITITGNNVNDCSWGLLMGEDGASGSIDGVTCFCNDFDDNDNSGVNSWGTITNLLPSTLGSDSYNQW